MKEGEPMEKSHKLQITVSENLYQQLKQVASEQSVSISALCNIGMTEYIRKLKRRQKPPEADTDSQKWENPPF